MKSVPRRPDSATTRPVLLRVRPDLLMRRQRFGREHYWVVKDPVALAYFHLRDEEHAILQMLDGRTSLADIKRRFEEAFAPLQMTMEQLQAFLGRLYRSGLVLSEATRQGVQLLARRQRQGKASYARLRGGFTARWSVRVSLRAPTGTRARTSGLAVKLPQHRSTPVRRRLNRFSGGHYTVKSG